jgi:hypothetical protein
MKSLVIIFYTFPAIPDYMLFYFFLVISRLSFPLPLNILANLPFTYIFPFPFTA